MTPPPPTGLNHKPGGGGAGAGDTCGHYGDGWRLSPVNNAAAVGVTLTSPGHNAYGVT